MTFIEERSPSITPLVDCSTLETIMTTIMCVCEQPESEQKAMLLKSLAVALELLSHPPMMVS